VLVGGDSTPFTKPHPRTVAGSGAAPGLAPEDCLYVGDDPRDVQAGLAAGMLTGAAAWGYLGPGADVAAWGAHAVLNGPQRSCISWNWPKLQVLGPTWLRRGCGVGAGHAEHQFARKSTGNKVTANDTSYALAA
jgi:hypothetical protein